MKDEAYTAAEAAQMLGLTRTRIGQLCRWSRGKIGVKFGPIWYLTPADMRLIRERHKPWRNRKKSPVSA